MNIHGPDGRLLTSSPGQIVGNNIYLNISNHFTVMPNTQADLQKDSANVICRNIKKEQKVASGDESNAGIVCFQKTAKPKSVKPEQKEKAAQIYRRATVESKKENKDANTATKEKICPKAAAAMSSNTENKKNEGKRKKKKNQKMKLKPKKQVKEEGMKEQAESVQKSDQSKPALPSRKKGKTQENNAKIRPKTAEAQNHPVEIPFSINRFTGKYSSVIPEQIKKKAKQIKIQKQEEEKKQKEYAERMEKTKAESANIRLQNQLKLGVDKELLQYKDPNEVWKKMAIDKEKAWREEQRVNWEAKLKRRREEMGLNTISEKAILAAREKKMEDEKVSSENAKKKRVKSAEKGKRQLRDNKALDSQFQNCPLTVIQEKLIITEEEKVKREALVREQILRNKYKEEKEKREKAEMELKKKWNLNQLDEKLRANIINKVHQDKPKPAKSSKKPKKTHAKKRRMSTGSEFNENNAPYEAWNSEDEEEIQALDANKPEDLLQEQIYKSIAEHQKALEDKSKNRNEQITQPNRSGVPETENNASLKEIQRNQFMKKVQQARQQLVQKEVKEGTQLKRFKSEEKKEIIAAPTMMIQAKPEIEPTNTIAKKPHIIQISKSSAKKVKDILKNQLESLRGRWVQQNNNMQKEESKSKTPERVPHITASLSAPRPILKTCVIQNLDTIEIVSANSPKEASKTNKMLQEEVKREMKGEEQERQNKLSLQRDYKKQVEEDQKLEANQVQRQKTPEVHHSQSPMIHLGSHAQDVDPNSLPGVTKLQFHLDNAKVYSSTDKSRAAVIIQKYVRGHLAREGVKKLKFGYRMIDEEIVGMATGSLRPKDKRTLGSSYKSPQKIWNETAGPMQIEWNYPSWHAEGDQLSIVDLFVKNNLQRLAESESNNKMQSNLPASVRPKSSHESLAKNRKSIPSAHKNSLLNESIQEEIVANTIGERADTSGVIAGSITPKKQAGVDTKSVTGVASGIPKALDDSNRKVSEIPEDIVPRHSLTGGIPEEIKHPENITPEQMKNNLISAVENLDAVNEKIREADNLMKKELAAKDKVILAQVIQHAEEQKNASKQVNTENKTLIDKFIETTKEMQNQQATALTQVIDKLVERLEGIAKPKGTDVRESPTKPVALKESKKEEKKEHLKKTTAEEEIKYEPDFENESLAGTKQRVNANMGSTQKNDDSIKEEVEPDAMEASKESSNKSGGNQQKSSFSNQKQKTPKKVATHQEIEEYIITDEENDQAKSNAAAGANEVSSGSIQEEINKSQPESVSVHSSLSHQDEAALMNEVPELKTQFREISLSKLAQMVKEDATANLLHANDKKLRQKYKEKLDAIAAKKIQPKERQTEISQVQKWFKTEHQKLQQEYRSHYAKILRDTASMVEQLEKDKEAAAKAASANAKEMKSKAATAIPPPESIPILPEVEKEIAQLEEEREKADIENRRLALIQTRLSAEKLRQEKELIIACKVKEKLLEEEEKEAQRNLQLTNAINVDEEVEKRIKAAEKLKASKKSTAQTATSKMTVANKDAEESIQEDLPMKNDTSINQSGTIKESLASDIEKASVGKSSQGINQSKTGIKPNIKPGASTEINKPAEELKQPIGQTSQQPIPKVPQATVNANDENYSMSYEDFEASQSTLQKNKETKKVEPPQTIDAKPIPQPTKDIPASATLPQKPSPKKDTASEKHEILSSVAEHQSDEEESHASKTETKKDIAIESEIAESLVQSQDEENKNQDDYYKDDFENPSSGGKTPRDIKGRTAEPESPYASIDMSLEHSKNVMEATGSASSHFKLSLEKIVKGEEKKEEENKKDEEEKVLIEKQKLEKEKAESEEKAKAEKEQKIDNVTDAVFNLLFNEQVIEDILKTKRGDTSAILKELIRKEKEVAEERKKKAKKEEEQKSANESLSSLAGLPSLPTKSIPIQVENANSNIISSPPAKLISGIRTDVSVIESYIDTVFKYVMQDPQRFLSALSVPMNRDPMFTMGQIQNEDDEYFNSIDQIVTQPVLPLEVYLEIEKTRKVSGIQTKPDNQQHETYLVEWTNIHNKCIFDAINDALDYYRPYGIKGPPLPWSRKTRELTYKHGDLNNISETLSAVKAKVMNWASTNAGVLTAPTQ